MASNKLGRASQRHGWFLIPEETQPPNELQRLQEFLAIPQNQGLFAGSEAEDYGLAQAILDPCVNSIHVSLLHERQHVPIRTHEHMLTLCDQLLRDGPATLSARDKRILLWDADCVLTLHRKLWSSPSARWPRWWQEAFQNYMKSLPQNETKAVEFSGGKTTPFYCNLHGQKT